MFTVLFFLTNSLQSQNASTANSLENILKTNTIGSGRTIAQLKLFDFYCKTDTVKANFYLSQLANDIDNERYEIASELIFEVGNQYYRYKNDYTNAIKYYNCAMFKAEEEKNDAQIFYECWLRYMYSTIGEHENARQHIINAIETAEIRKNTKYLPFAYLVFAFDYKNANE